MGLAQLMDPLGWAKSMTDWHTFFAALGALVAVIGAVLLRPFRTLMDTLMLRAATRVIAPLTEQIDAQAAQVAHLRALVSARAIQVNQTLAEVRQGYAQLQGGLASVAEDAAATDRRIAAAMAEIEALPQQLEARFRLQDGRLADHGLRLNQIETTLEKTRWGG